MVTVNVNGIEWNKDKVKNLLLTNDQAVIRGIIRIWEKQTEDEKVSETTNRNNNVGFTGVDAYILTEYVNFYNRNKYLSQKQTALARKKIIKYSGQLLRIMQEDQTKKLN